MDIESTLCNVRKRLKQHRLPSISLKPKAEPAVFRWSSKFGGMPYWLKNMTYPTSNQGVDLILLAQLNFDELPVLEGYPETGLLQFFIAEGDTYGLDFDAPLEKVLSHPSGYRVVYHETVITSETELAVGLPHVSSESDFFPLMREYRLEAVHTDDLPSPMDYRYTGIAGDPFDLGSDVVERIFDEFTSEGSKVGGYANFTQDDPRGYSDQGNWLLLFQMDTECDGDVDIMWGDMGVANFFIEENALKKQDFSRIWYNWDCC